MIARNATGATDDIWSAIAAPLQPHVIQWRQDGKPVARDGRFIARFVAFIDAQFVRERLDTVVPGEWDLTLTPLPNRVAFSGEEEAEPYAFTARLQILGVHRESVGQGKDYKTAETDAFKRAAVRFGIGAELYAFGPNWVQMDGDGKYAKPVEDPSVAYTRRQGRGNEGSNPSRVATTTDERSSVEARSSNGRTPQPPAAVQSESCPKCDGPMWSNIAENDARAAKGEKLRPDWKCRDRACDGVIWRPKPAPNAVPFRPGDEAPHPADAWPDEIPF